MSREIKRVTYDNFTAEGKELFGTDNPYEWWFKCPVCGHKQQAKDMVSKYPEHKQYITESAYFSCEGRINGKGKSFLKDNPNAEDGCDYTNGGLFGLYTKVVLTPEKEIPVFEFAVKE